MFLHESEKRGGGAEGFLVVVVGERHDEYVCGESSSKALYTAV